MDRIKGMTIAEIGILISGFNLLAFACFNSFFLLLSFRRIREKTFPHHSPTCWTFPFRFTLNILLIVKYRYGRQ